MKESAASICVHAGPGGISAASLPPQTAPCKLLGCYSAQRGPASAPRQLPALPQVGSYSNEWVEESIGVIIMNKIAGVNQIVPRLESGICCCYSFCCLGKQVSCSFIYLFIFILTLASFTSPLSEPAHAPQTLGIHRHSQSLVWTALEIVISPVIK